MANFRPIWSHCLSGLNNHNSERKNRRHLIVDPVCLRFVDTFWRFFVDVDTFWRFFNDADRRRRFLVINVGTNVGFAFVYPSVGILGIFLYSSVTRRQNKLERLSLASFFN
jgi:hypothetical protein